jgi:hypothetical protein
MIFMGIKKLLLVLKYISSSFKNTSLFFQIGFEKSLDLRTYAGTIDDAHLTEDGDGAQGPSGPQCLAGRILGTWLPL